MFEKTYTKSNQKDEVINLKLLKRSCTLLINSFINVSEPVDTNKSKAQPLFIIDLINHTG